MQKTRIAAATAAAPIILRGIDSWQNKKANDALVAERRSYLYTVKTYAFHLTSFPLKIFHRNCFQQYLLF